MPKIDPFLLAFLLVVGGLSLWGLAFRMLRRKRAVGVTESAGGAGNRPGSGDWPQHDEAVVIVEPGGRLVSMNQTARTFFELSKDEAVHLEGLARRARPAQAFLGLCGGEGRAQMSIGSRLVEAVSYSVPGSATGQQVIALREIERGSGMIGEDGELTSKALRLFIEISQSMAASLDLTDTLQAVLENVEKLVPADWREITLWDAENEILVPYRLIGRPEDGWSLEAKAHSYTLNDGYTGYLASQRAPLFLTDVDERPDLSPAAGPNRVPLRAYLGVPLMVGDELVGTLELGSLTPGAFKAADFDLVRLISGQAAIAIHNARMYRLEQRRVAELSGLAEVSRSFASVRDRATLFDQLTRQIAQLVPVEVAGFLLYNENSRSLEGQAPFYGLPEEVVGLYRVPVPVGSPAEAILLARQPVMTENASEDPQWKAYGLDGIAQAASLRETVLSPLTSGGQVLGFLQVSNHRNGSGSFSADELRLLTIVANQVAPVIENAALVQQARQRAQRAEALRRITSLSNSAVTFTEILQFSLVELVRLLGGDRGGVFLLDEDRSTLRLDGETIFGPPPDLTYKQMQLKVEDPQFPFTVTGRQQPLRSGSLLEEKTLIPFYQTLGLGWGVQSVVAVPLVVRNRGIGELWIGSPNNHAFDQGDVQVAAVAAGQLAGVVEQSFLAAQTDERLRQRVNQLTTLTRLARQLSAASDVKIILQIVFDELLKCTGAQRGVIQIFDPAGLDDGQFSTLYFAGDLPAESLSDAELSVLADGEPVCLAGDGANTDSACLLVPIHYRQRAVGLIRLESDDADLFTAEQVETVSSLAAQAGLALGGAVELDDQIRRSEQIQQALRAEVEGAVQAQLPDLIRTVQNQAEEIRRLQQQSEGMRAGLEIAERVAHQPDHQSALAALARELMNRFGLQVALTAEWTASGPDLLGVHGALPADARPETLFGQRNPLRYVLQEDRLCVVPDLNIDPEWANCPLLTVLGARSFIAMPLKVAGQNRLGLLVVGQQPLAGYQQGGEQIFARLQRQIEISMQNMSLLAETRRRLSEVNRLLDFSRRLGSLDSKNILKALLESAMNLVPGFQAGWVAVWEEDQRLLRIETAIGYSHPTYLQGLCFSAERSATALPLHVVTDGLPRRLAELDFARSYPLPTDDLLNYRRATDGRLPVSSLLTPIRLGWRVLGVVTLDNFESAGAFSAVDEKLTLSLAQQAALALENSRLYEESRRSTEDLEQRVQERTAELTRAHRNSQTLLRLITELSASLDLDQVLNRALAVLNETTGAEQSLIVLAANEQVYKSGVPILAGHPQPDGERPERDLARQVMRTRAPILSGDVTIDEQVAVGDRDRVPFSSVLALPLTLGEDTLGALLLLHREPEAFYPDQVPLLEATARQISITLNNAELFTLIRDQSERLGTMLREQQIQSSQSLAILEAIADGVVVTDKNNRITLFNASAERILGLEAQQVLRRRLDEFGGLFGPHARTWIDTIRAWADKPDELYRRETYAEQMTLDNGRVVAVHLAPAVWRHEFLGTVSIFRDITHEVQVDRLKSEFVANVSHELRTPLTSIKGYVDLMLKGAAGSFNESQAHFLQIVQENTERLTYLVNDLLDISKIESGKVDLEIEPLDLAQIAADVADEARLKAEQENRPLRVELEISQPIPPVPGDYSRIRQVFANLVSNAYNYTPPEGLIHVQVRAENGTVQVDVHDNGIGIAPEVHDRIFERFYRGEDPLVLATAGTGLGLAIAKIIVEMHHGKIWFNSSGVRGEGSTFSFTLPVEQSEG